ncbi:MAG: pyridoxal-phosphate dependent enzyme [Acidobacteriota bacterium]|nr:pyridoxal-phosphate dependent enzyme [Acidobacteriota bacterium]
MSRFTVDALQRDQNAAWCRERGIRIPTLAQMRDPATMPEAVVNELADIGLWDVHPRNLFRITWKNEPVARGGSFGDVNHVVMPPALTGCRANILALCGKWFPTGAHKVGATFGCLVPKLITGAFNPETTRAVWPSTGNYCRGGAYVSKLLDCASIAILPENMSRERFAWLENIAGEVIATPGCESNVKEIFDACWELRRTRDDIHIFNQFRELGNPMWHYQVTGAAALEALERAMPQGHRFVGSVFSSGSAGTLGAGYRLKKHFPRAKLAVSEALQCPTLLYNGHGDHRIEGIGDKHVPWIHDVHNTDMIIGVDDEDAMRLLRFFNEPEGRKRLIAAGVPEELTERLDLMGISCIANLVAAIKMARYYELTERDWLVTVFTDSLDLYASRLDELTEQRGPYHEGQAWRDLELLQGLDVEHVLELRYPDRKRVHNLKYFTWIEQQQRDVAELEAQWSDHENYWSKALECGDELDNLIQDFNERIQSGS